ncbi:lysosomal proton-coupled steroid conjugate and bile acid symporter SLC46A3-like isoform X2 [Tubulanus polymorphus]|uniref:lysosomal proton-coupled steroid conjugate and bile acid symporter SLC46A3-like isoform X2 n=1 Tax=Tubulanus polymorphus TaxID=672921 RepID=UPI003DA47C29
MPSVSSARFTSCVGYLRKVTVEPVLFLYMIAVWMQYPALQALLYKKTCLLKYDSSEICDNLNEYESEEKYVQSETSHWILYTNICLTLPSIISAAFIGSWSDKIGRKIPIILPSIGAVFGLVNYVLNSMFPKLPLPLILLSPFLNGIAGGFVTCILSVFSYMSNITSESNRTIRVAVLESMSFLGGTIGLSLSGVLLDHLGFQYVFVIMIVCHFILIVYTLLWIDDVHPADQIVEQNTNLCRHLFNLTHFKESAICLFRPRDGHLRRNLLLTFGAFLGGFFAFSAHNDLAYLYLRHAPRNFTQTEYGYYLGFTNAMSGIGLIVILPLFKHYLLLWDTILIIIGFSARGIALIVLAVSMVKWLVFLVPVIGMFQGFGAAGCRALLSKFVDKDETGKMFAFVASGESLITLLASVIFNNLYPATISFYPGFCFILAAAMMIIPIIIIGFVHKFIKQEDRYSLFENTGDLQAEPS